MEEKKKQFIPVFDHKCKMIKRLSLPRATQPVVSKTNIAARI